MTLVADGDEIKVTAEDGEVELHLQRGKGRRVSIKLTATGTFWLIQALAAAELERSNDRSS